MFKSSTRRLVALLPAIGLVIGTGASVRAADINVLSASALKVIVTELSEKFRKESGHTIDLEFATAGAVEKRILAGETPDVFIATDVQMKGIAEKGLTKGVPVIIARVGLGIAVKEGAPKPDISNVKALKKTLLAAKSVTYPDPTKGGASGIHFASVIDKLGIAEPIKAKSILGANPDLVCVSVAKGEAAMCVHQITEIMAVKGVILVGPLPREVQKITTFAVAASAKASSPDTARAFARFLARADLKETLGWHAPRRRSGATASSRARPQWYTHVWGRPARQEGQARPCRARERDRNSDDGQARRPRYWHGPQAQAADDCSGVTRDEKD